MIERLREAVAVVAEVTQGLDPSVLHGDDAEELVELFTKGERLCASGRTLCARRAADAKAWRREGFASPEDWLAKKTGSTRAQAHRSLRLGEQLEGRAETRAEFTKGHLSETQAGIVAGAAEENPGAEEELLDTARQESVKALTEAAARARAQAGDEEARQARLHRRRYAAGGTDEEGAYRLTTRMALFQGGILDTVWRRFREQVYREAKARQERKSAGQVGADALVLMAQTALEHLEGEGAQGALSLPEVQLNLLVDHRAWERGQARAGERCEIDGLGPITVAQAEALVARGAFVTASVTTGSEVSRVAHLGTLDPATLSRHKVHEVLAGAGVDVQALETDSRHVPAVLDTALTIRDRVCRHAGCDRRYGLERDHVLAVELGGLTSYRNLQRLCWHHHQQKTRDDMAKIRARRREARRPSARAGPAP